MDVRVEMNESIFSDEVRKVEEYERRLKSALLSTLNISANVKMVGPKTIERSEGKAKRVIDNRIKNK